MHRREFLRALTALSAAVSAALGLAGRAAAAPAVAPAVAAPTPPRPRQSFLRPVMVECPQCGTRMFEALLDELDRAPEVYCARCFNKVRDEFADDVDSARDLAEPEPFDGPEDRWAYEDLVARDKRVRPALDQAIGELESQRWDAMRAGADGPPRAIETVLEILEAARA